MKQKKQNPIAKVLLIGSLITPIALILGCFSMVSIMLYMEAGEFEIVNSPEKLTDKTTTRIQFKCKDIRSVALNDTELSIGDLELLCEGGKVYELDEGENEFVFIATGAQGKIINETLVITLDPVAYKEKEQRKIESMKEDFKVMYTNARKAYSNYDDISTQLGTNVFSYELYKYFKNNSYEYTQCAVYGIDLGNTDNYNDNIKEDIESLKQSLKDYCSYMEQVGDHVIKYNDNRSYSDLQEVEKYNNLALFEAANVEVILSGIANELGVNIDELE